MISGIHGLSGRDMLNALAAGQRDPKALAQLARGAMRGKIPVCAQDIIAEAGRAHARSGDRIAIAAYLGGSDVFDWGISKFAAVYAGQNERDHDSLTGAVASGLIKAERDL